MALWDEHKHARFHGKFSAMGINRQTLAEKFKIHIGEEAKSPHSGKIGSTVTRENVVGGERMPGVMGAVVHEQGDRYSAHIHSKGVIEKLSDQHFHSKTEAAAAIAQHWSENGHGESVIGSAMDEPMGSHPGEPGFDENFRRGMESTPAPGSPGQPKTSPWKVGDRVKLKKTGLEQVPPGTVKGIHDGYHTVEHDNGQRSNVLATELKSAGKEKPRLNDAQKSIGAGQRKRRAFAPDSGNQAVPQGGGRGLSGAQGKPKRRAFADGSKNTAIPQGGGRGLSSAPKRKRNKKGNRPKA